MRLPVREIGLAMATLLPEAYGKQATFKRETYAGTVINPRDTLNFDDDLSVLGTLEHTEKLISQAQQRRRVLTPPMLPESLSWIEFGVSRTYMERIISMADAHGTKVVFLFLPFYTGPDAPIELDWLEQRGPLWKGNFMKDNPQNYVDSAHLAASPRVKSLMTDWFAENISALLAETK
jgi:hypothetical protein